MKVRPHKYTSHGLDSHMVRNCCCDYVIFVIYYMIIVRCHAQFSRQTSEKIKNVTKYFTYRLKTCFLDLLFFFSFCYYIFYSVKNKINLRLA